jgi:hypothetical protein
VVGANWTVTAHDLPLPSAVPLQVSEVIENAVAPDPESETLSIPVAEPPELVSVNAFEAVCPGVTAP